MRYLLTFLLALSPVQSSLANPPLQERDYSNFFVGAYRLNLKTLENGIRVRPPETLHCFDDYDYVLLYDHVFDARVKCRSSIADAKSDRDRICVTEKAEIRKSRDLQLNLCNSQKDSALAAAENLRLEISTLKAEHSKQLTTHYIIGGGAAVVIVGLLTTVVVLSVK